MPAAAGSSVVRQLESLFDSGSVAGFSDRQLVECFVTSRHAVAEAAFAALVTRHGPMVLAVSRTILGDRNEADDAFQAVFLVLARKARSISDPDLLANWLYGVALRTAKKARSRRARRRKLDATAVIQRLRPHSGMLIDPLTPVEAISAQEQAEALHNEIDRLATPFRLPIVLCYFEGLTIDDAAKRLHCPAGTIRSRLTRACEKLRRGLARRGFVLSAAAITSALSARSASASVSYASVDATTRAALRFAAGQTTAGATSAAADALARQTLRSLPLHRLGVVAVAFILIGVAFAGAMFAAGAPRRQAGKPDLLQNAKPDDIMPKPVAGRMFVTGRVIDANGKPVPGAEVAAYARIVESEPLMSVGNRAESILGNTRADGSGRFRIDAKRTSSAHCTAFGAVVLAPGFGAAWIALDPDAEQPTAEIVLRPELLVHGRLFDLQGRPVPDVTLSVAWIRKTPPQAPNQGRPRFDGVSYLFPSPDDIPAWPKTVKTDAEGRYTLQGLSDGTSAALTVHHSRFANQLIEVAANSASEPKPATAALVPAQILNGRVTYSDTGKGVPHARLVVFSSRGTVAIVSDFETDAEGRFRLNPPPADRWHNVTVYPPAQQPYLIAKKRIDWPKGALEQSFDVVLPRGVSVHGRVVEEGTGKPVARAHIEFRPRGVRQNTENTGIGTVGAEDGSYQIGTPATPGYLVVRAPSDDFALEVVGAQTLEQGKPGGYRRYAHAFRALDLKSDATEQTVDLVLRGGVTVSGSVVGPDERPVSDAWIFCHTILNPRNGEPRTWSGSFHGATRHGQFELHGLDPGAETTVVFLEPKRKLGGTVAFTGNAAATRSVTIRLEPCGAAKVRVVDPNGKPVAGPLSDWFVMMLATPGALPGPAAAEAGLLTPDAARINVVDAVNYPAQLAADAEGRLTLPVLIPGVTYRILDYTAAIRGRTGPEIRKEFAVKPGEKIDLGSLLIAKPAR